MTHAVIDGRFVSAADADIGLLLGAQTYAHHCQRLQGCQRAGRGARYVDPSHGRGAGIRPRTGGQVWNDQSVILRKGRRMDAVAPIWEGVTIIPDEVTKAKAGQIVITAVMLYAVKVLRTDGFARKARQTDGVMDIFGVWPAVLEVRQVGGARVLRGTFNYGSTATIADRGRVRKETFASRAFNYAIERAPERRIDLLVGHDFGKPIASRQARTLTLKDSDSGVSFEALLPGDPPSWVVDAEKAIAAGLMTGLSPGFSVPPRAAVPDAERLEPEPGNPGVMIRHIRAAVLREFSVVTSPVYQDALVELRGADIAGAFGAGLYGRGAPTLETLWL